TNPDGSQTEHTVPVTVKPNTDSTVTPAPSVDLTEGKEIPADTSIGKVTDKDDQPVAEDKVVVDSTTVPEGTEVTYNPETGELEITGTPTTPGDKEVKVTVTNPDGSQTEHTVPVTVKPNQVDETITVTPGENITLEEGKEIPADSNIGGVTDPEGKPVAADKVTIDPTTVPDGTTVTYNPETGGLEISGTPTTPGDFNVKVTVPGADGTDVVTEIPVTVTPAADNTPIVTPGNANNLVEGTEIPTDSNIGKITDPEGNLYPADKVVVDDTTVPTGTVVTYDPTTGEITISGTPETSGDFNVKVTITDPDGTTHVVEIPVKVAPKGDDTPDTGDNAVVTPNGDLNLTEGEKIPADTSIGTVLDPEGNPLDPTDVSIDSSTLPDGTVVEYDPTTGELIISGTPKAAGEFTVTITVTGADGTTEEFTIPVTVKAKPVIPSPSPTPTPGDGSSDSTLPVPTPKPTPGTGSSGGILPILPVLPIPGAGSSGGHVAPAPQPGTGTGQGTGEGTVTDPNANAGANQGQGQHIPSKGIDPAQQPKRHGPLAVTGADVAKTGIIASILAMLGAFMLAVSKRRRPEEDEA
ncbi:Rib/alpha-like domain-containing protein, partial [Corynebacterium spheniscorum]